MHQRHVVVTGTGSGGEAPCCSGHHHHHPPAKKDSDNEGGIPTLPKEKRVRTRRSKQQSWWPFTARKRLAGSTNPKHYRNFSLFQLVDMDMFATFLQVFSILLMMACVITLLANAMTSSGEEESSWWSFMWSGSGGGFSLPANPHPHGVGLNAKYPKVALKPSAIYTIPGSMDHIGDKSDRYALLRKELDDKMARNEVPPVTKQVEFAAVPIPSTDAAYDIYNCPEEPPQGYPYQWNLLQVLKEWPPDDPTPRPRVFQGLCVFDYTKEADLRKAYRYRDAELPFVVQGDPDVYQAAQRWNAPQYMERLLGQVRHRAEYSETNHFLYWNPPLRGGRHAAQKPRRRGNEKLPQDWKEPTKMMRMTYGEWLDHANMTDDSLLGPEMPHWYFRLIGCGETGPEGQCDNGSSEYLFDELPFFQPKNSLYMVDPEEQKGIHCRFGMKGVIAENHFDGSRNAIVVLGGERRYILAHPEQCPYLSLLPKGHPSARHSAVDWSNPDLDAYPEFSLAKGNEVVLQAGDVLYLPTNWFHYIISLSLNFQCNTRSGIGLEYMEPIHHCGF